MTHAGAFTRSALTQLTAAFDSQQSQLDQFCQEWKCQPEGSVAGLLAHHRPDIVSICSPNETHFSLLKEVVSFKPRAVICEKPLALELSEAKEMVEMARKAGVILAVNYMRRWDTALAGIKSRLGAGELGKVRGARVVYTKGLFHNASHGINLLQDWLGPVTESRWLKRVPWRDQDPGGDFVLSFSGGVDAHFQWCDADDYSVFEVEVFTSEARILLSGGGNCNTILSRAPSAIVPGTYALSATPEVIPGTLQNVMIEVVDNVARAVIEGDTLKMPAEDALATTAVCASLRDCEEGRP